FQTARSEESAARTASYRPPAPSPAGAESLRPVAGDRSLSKPAPKSPPPPEGPVEREEDAPADFEHPTCELILAREEDPTAENPLTYRERTYFVPPEFAAPSVEVLLRSRLAEIQAELEAAPKGKFVQLAVFDHHFKDEPMSPPVATLEWKDWRGDPVVLFPLSGIVAGQGRKEGSSPGLLSRAPESSPPARPPSEPPSPSEPPGDSKPPSDSAADARTPPPRPSFDRTSTDEQDQRLALAFESAQDLLFLKTPIEGLELAVRLLDELVPSEASAGCVYDIDTDEFRFAVLRGTGADLRRGDAIPSATGLFGWATKRTIPIRLDDLTSDTRFVPDVEGREPGPDDPYQDDQQGFIAKNAIYVPLIHEGLLLGMIQLLNRKDRHAFSETDAEISGYLGRQLAHFMVNAKLSMRPASE
ncbi:MAG: GAF domain-containing protein, partial [Myxococcales bacterium]|nr:GAF domain-containing protein [Myxococcales bacterium]